MDDNLVRLAEDLLHKIGAKVESEEKTKKFTVMLPTSVYTLFRIRATLNEQTLQEAMVDAVMDYIRK